MLKQHWLTNLQYYPIRLQCYVEIVTEKQLFGKYI
jgi:hypothetical protein